MSHVLHDETRHAERRRDTEHHCRGGAGEHAVDAMDAHEVEVSLAGEDDDPEQQVRGWWRHTPTNAWNSLPITAMLAPNTAYWLMFNTNGDNNMSYDTGSANQGAWSQPRPFGTWPSSFGTATRWIAKYSIYAS